MRGDIVGTDGDPDNLSKEQQEAWNTKVADYRSGYDAMLDKFASNFHDLLQCGDMKGYWALWCHIF